MAKDGQDKTVNVFLSSQTKPELSRLTVKNGRKSLFAEQYSWEAGDPYVKEAGKISSGK